jgi:hypothetical protein
MSAAQLDYANFGQQVNNDWKRMPNDAARINHLGKDEDACLRNFENLWKWCALLALIFWKFWKCFEKI